jgi:hypothetical protein
MFAVLAAWVLVGEAVTAVQAMGGAIVLVGLVLARQGDRTDKAVDDDLAAALALLNRPRTSRRD